MDAGISSRPTYVRVYADERGETHFEDVHVPRERRESPTGTVDEVTAAIPVEGLVFRLVVSEASDTEPHNAPRRLFIVQVDGSVEVEVSDGEKRVVGPGSVLLVEDTTGKGHVTRSLTPGPRATLIAALT
jgi:quercetin dioxygenase-like cupin family protein